MSFKLVFGCVGMESCIPMFDKCCWSSWLQLKAHRDSDSDNSNEGKRATDSDDDGDDGEANCSVGMSTRSKGPCK